MCTLFWTVYQDTASFVISQQHDLYACANSPVRRHTAQRHLPIFEPNFFSLSFSRSCCNRLSSLQALAQPKHPNPTSKNPMDIANPMNIRHAKFNLGHRGHQKSKSSLSIPARYKKPPSSVTRMRNMANLLMASALQWPL